MRKRRWDVVFIVQDFGMVDKQARCNIAQHVVTCSSSKDYWLFKPFPKFHSAVVRHTASGLVVERWYYRARDVIEAYDTEQLFHTDADDTDFIVDSDSEMGEKERHDKELNGLYCVLPPAYYSTEKKKEIAQRFDSLNKSRIRTVQAISAALVLCVLGFLFYPSDVVSVEPAAVVDSSDQQHNLVTDSTQYFSEDETAGVYKFNSFRITRLVNMFGTKSFTISDGFSTYTSEQIESQGYGVRFRQGGEVMIVDSDRNFVRLFL